MIKMKRFSLFLFWFGTILTVSAQTGSVNEPIRFIGGQSVDPYVHEGRLRYAIGTESRQTMRANRTHPELSDDHGWTYNHGANLCYWNNRFYQHYLSNPADEHMPPGQTLVLTSADGRNWSKPEVVFPPYTAPPGVKIPDGYTVRFFMTQSLIHPIKLFQTIGCSFHVISCFNQDEKLLPYWPTILPLTGLEPVPALAS